MIKLCSLERAWYPVVKRYGLDEIKYLYLLFILPLLVVLFFNPIESKKRIWGFRIDKKLSP
jgi:hypothetical protein